MTKTLTQRVLEADELEGGTFEGLALREASLDRKVFVDCTFVDSVWTQANVRRCLFESCVFRGCDMTMMSPYDSSFRQARFERCKVMGVDWRATTPSIRRPTD